MRAVLDACVLYPTVLREILVALAEAGAIDPRDSVVLVITGDGLKTLDAVKQARIAGVEAALLAERFPGAMAPDDGVRAAGLDLPDPADGHVVEAALAAGAGLIVTANLRDFPRRALAAVGLEARHPDELLLALWRAEPQTVEQVVEAVHARAEALGAGMTRREMLKRVRLPRLAKALG